MATIIVSIICIAMIVVGGITLSQGILTSTDTTATGVDEISLRESEISRTSLDISRGAYLSWADLIRVTVVNTGQTKLASFSKWDVIIHYYDGGAYHTEWLPYTTEGLDNNEWEKARIGLNGPFEYFEPDILNPGEELVILAKLNPLPGEDTTGNVTIATPNGIYDNISFSNLSYTLLVPHSENTTIANTDYFQLVEATPADGPAMTLTTDAFAEKEAARKVMYDENQPSRLARHVFPLTGISEIPPTQWEVNYRCRTWGDPDFPDKDNDVNFDIDILIRKADGTIRTIIATDEADAYLDKGEAETWFTKKANYSFPGYTVIDDSDYLEIVFYGEADKTGPGNGPGYLQIRIDDINLVLDDQTRIEG